jgi:sulfite reductase alpha subunit-like flavoprotein
MTSLCLAGLSSLHNKPVVGTKLVHRKNLQSSSSERETILVQLDLEGEPVLYEPGDHAAVYPLNPPEHVATLLARLAAGAPKPHQLVKLEWLKEKQTPLGKHITTVYVICEHMGR